MWKSHRVSMKEPPGKCKAYIWPTYRPNSDHTVKMQWALKQMPRPMCWLYFCWRKTLLLHQKPQCIFVKISTATCLSHQCMFATQWVDSLCQVSISKLVADDDNEHHAIYTSPSLEPLSTSLFFSSIHHCRHNLLLEMTLSSLISSCFLVLALISATHAFDLSLIQVLSFCNLFNFSG